MKKLLSFLLFVFLFLPLVQEKTGVFTLRPLDGVFPEPEEAVLTIDYWLSGQFQQKRKRSLNERMGFRELFIRINNQMDYSLFSEANAEGVVLGRHRIPYEKDYVRAYAGDDFVGKDFIEKKVRRACFVKDRMQEDGVRLMVLLEPGKASTYPENLPSRSLRENTRPVTNYTEYLGQLKKFGIPVLDINGWFSVLGKTSPYPLIPRNGIHWTDYGAWLAGDTLLRFASEILGYPLCSLHLDSLVPGPAHTGSDDDLIKPMNLLFTPAQPKPGTPYFSYRCEPHSRKPRVLIIGDSFYWKLNDLNLDGNVFSEEVFWYYDKQVYPESYLQEKLTSSLDILQVTKNYDLVILALTERFFYRMDFGFFDRYFNACTPELSEDMEYEITNKILSEGPWFDQILRTAQKDNIPTSVSLQNNVMYILKTEQTDDYLLRYGIVYYEEMIKGDEAWYAGTRENAKKNGVRPEEQLSREAEAFFQTDKPELYKKYCLVREMLKEMKTDPATVIEARNNRYYLTEEEYLWQKAIGRATDAI